MRVPGRFACVIYSLGGNGRDGFEKVPNPTFPVTIGTHGGKSSIVFIAMLLEEKAQVKKRRGKQFPMLEQKRDQKTSNSAVTVEIGVNSLELYVQ